MDNRPVGVYDSGLGGLTVWREIRRQLPEESLVYLGDGKNCPYGARPADEICRLADEAVGRLVGAGCKMVVVACNTATAAAIVLGVRISKAQRLSNWEAATLTPKQQLYAATDAWVCTQIYERLQHTPKIKRQKP